MTQQKQFLYIPSLSTGSISLFLKKNTPLDGTPYTYRFYGPDFPEQFKWKSFLLTAGHHYRDANARANFGLGDDTLVFGDSGGYQIATGTIKWKPEIRETIFHWLENNSDIAMNLDIPPAGRAVGGFQECLDISKANFKYFYENQTGKTKFLNVLQGSELDSRESWYKEIKDFQFYGWSVALLKSPMQLMGAIVCLLKNRELEKSKWLHFLGISSVSDFYFLAHLQFLLNKHGYDITVSTDSSTPSRASVFATMYHSFQLKQMSFVTLSLSREDIKGLGYETNDNFLPQSIEHPFKIKLSELQHFDNNVYNKLCTHNFIILTEAYKQISSLFVLELDHLRGLIDTDMFNVLKSLDEVFANPEDADKIYWKNMPLYRKFDYKINKADTSNQDELLKDLFE